MDVVICEMEIKFNFVFSVNYCKFQIIMKF